MCFLEFGFSIFWSLSLIGSTFISVAGTCFTTVHTKFHGILATFGPREVSHEVQQVELRATCRGDKISPKLVLQNYKTTRGHVTATCPWDMYPQHFHVCANVVILSLLHVPAARPCYLSPQCVLHKFLSLKHVAATCPCNMTPRVGPPLIKKYSRIQMQKKHQLILITKEENKLGIKTHAY